MKTLNSFIRKAVITIIITLATTSSLLAQTNVCEINSVGYETLDDALAEVKDGETIKMLQNYTYNEGISISNKSITFDVNGFILNVENSSGNGLDVYGASGEVKLIDSGTGGEFNVSGAEGDSYGVWAANGGKAEVTNATGVLYGVRAKDENTIVKVGGDVEATDDNSYGVAAADGAFIEVTGNVKGIYYGAAAYYSGSSVKVHGNAEATGSNGIGAYAYEGGAVVVVGDITGVPGGIHAIREGSKVEAGSNVEAKEGVGVYITGEAEVIIEGVITIDTNGIYIITNGKNKAQEDYEAITAKIGYFEYNDETSYVWVKSTDTTAPSLTAGTVDRTSDTEATIGFTTDEAGTAYYLVVNSGDTAPTSTAVKAGTSLGSVAASAVSDKSVALTAGAKDIYVVVEDASGNISVPLKIEAEEYIHPVSLDLDISANNANTSYLNWSCDATGNNYTIIDNVTIIGTVTGVTGTINFNIASGKKATWQANLSGAVTGSALVKVSGSGLFEAVNGKIEQTGSGLAIESTSNIDVSGGKITATTGEAIQVLSGNSVTLSGGLVFAYGDNIEGAGNVINMSSGSPTISGSGVVVAWNEASGNTVYLPNSTNDISKAPAGATAVWGASGSDNGISYTNGANTGFIPLPVVVSDPTYYSIYIDTFSNGNVTANPATATAGTTITLTISPDANYELSYILVYKTGESEITVETLRATSLQYTFIMPAYNVTVMTSFKKTQEVLDAEAVEETKAEIEEGTYIVTQEEANTEAAVKAWLVGEINGLLSDYGITIVAADITLSGFNAAVAGKSNRPAGTNGSFRFTVSISKGSSSLTTTSLTGIIIATAYVPPADYAINIAKTINGTVTASSERAAIGTIVTLSIVPDAYYELSSISAIRTNAPSFTVTLSGEDNTRTFTMPAYNVTVTATFRLKTQEDIDKEAVETAKAEIEGGTYSVAQAVANTESAVKAWLVGKINGYNGFKAFNEISITEDDITISNFATAAEGTEAIPDGTNGSFIFTVTLTKGEATLTTSEIPGIIEATPYDDLTNIGVETGRAPSLQAYAINGQLHVSGLTVGDLWAIYNISGSMIYQSKAIDEKADVYLNTSGIYIIVSGMQRVKVVML